jgi:selenide,water dikinase
VLALIGLPCASLTGTGTILAADMRAQAKGRWVDEAIQSMLLPNRVAAAVLHQYGATACTDVTGFGLLGHLIEMIQYEDSGLTDAEDSEGVAGKAPAEENTVELWLSEVPTLPGATECIEAGIVSSLQPQVRRCVRHVVLRSAPVQCSSLTHLL